MINNVILMGRITHDLELKQSQSGVSYLSFLIAVERDYAPQGQERQADFIRCTAFRNTAEFIEKYFGKGRMIAIAGRLTSDTYTDKNGQRTTSLSVTVDKASFTGEQKNTQSVSQKTQTAQTNSNPPNMAADFADFETFDDEGTPF